MSSSSRQPVPEPGRVARVSVSVEGSTDIAFGSGYRISNRLVLTAAHQVVGTGTVLVDLGGDGDYRPAERMWQDERTDVALLRFAEAPPTKVTPVRLGRVDRARAATVTADALGYPAHTDITDSHVGERWRGRHHVSGRIANADTGSPGTLRFQLDSTPAPAAPGDSPWKGMSGAAVIARDSGLLVALFRGHAPSTGVSAHEVSALDAIDDPRWRELLLAEGVSPDPRPALPDGWRTGGHLTFHHEYVDTVAARGSELTSHRLPFVDPGPRHPASPRNVLDRLTELAAEAGTRIGVVLSGPSGTGKERLRLETAVLADEEGWLVIHLDEQVSLEAAWASVRPYSRRVLLVADDIESLTDSEMTVSGLRSAAVAAGSALAVLVSARTTALKNAWYNPLRPQHTFDDIEVPAGPGHQTAVVRMAVRTHAGAAVQQIGERRVVRLCAGPPAIALLLAQYFHNEAVRGHDLSRAVPLDAGDITGWLRHVLDTERLTLPRPAEDRYAWDGEPEPHARLVDVAKIAASAPRPREGFDAGLDGLIGVLSGVGLLEERGGAVHMAHDLYTDQLLSRVLLKGDLATVRTTCLEAVLETGLSGPQALGNVIRALNRLHDALGETSGGQLAGTVEQWFNRRIDNLGQLIAEDPQGRALLALLRGGAWRSLVQRSPAAVVEPWQRRNFLDPQARHALVAAASYLDASHGQSYLMGWIDKNAVLPQAAFAFEKALPAEGDDPAFGEWTVNYAYEYVTHNPQRLQASRVFVRLLDTSKGGMSPRDPRAAQVVTWALGWLSRHATRPEAGFVAPQLVLRPEVTGPELAATARYLLDTVATRDPREASFALEPVLRRHRLRKDLPEAVFKQAVKDSLAWLEADDGYGLLAEAGYVLGELLCRGLPGRDDTPRAVECAWRWLDRHVDSPQAGLVLDPLLTKARQRAARAEAMLTPDECAELARLTTRWLSGPDSERRQRASVLGALLRTKLLDDDHEVLERHAQAALELLDDSSGPTLARTLLPPLLAKALDDGTRNRLLDLTFGYLRRHPVSEHSSYPLTALLSRNLTDGQFRDAVTATLRWVDAHPSEESAFRLLARALGSPRAAPPDRGRLAGRVVRILSVDLLVTDQQHHLTRDLLRYRGEIGPEWNRFVARACRVLADAGLPSNTMTVLRSMLKGADRLDAPTLESLHLTCVTWCEVHPRTPRTSELLSPVLASRALSPAVRPKALAVGHRLLGPSTARTQNSGKLLVALLRLGGPDLVPDGEPPGVPAADRVLGISLDWLDAWPNDRGAFTLLQQVAHRLRQGAGTAYGPGTPGSARAERAIRHLDAWLARNTEADPEARAAAEAHRRDLANRVA
ncbi:S1 family peptidase [Streptomyces odonnellii]|uniref:S1 family peptidase n=1 Tax=Streptomyces odonnellii TaxID=1417980 RepID=UPI000AFCBC22|nr:serine protease [Streptomyces odonnellii]